MEIKVCIFSTTVHYQKNISDSFYRHLTEAIDAILTDRLTQAQEQFLIHAAHELSSNIIRIKFSVSPAIRYFLGLNEKDLGYDCIAELFERDRMNRLVHFKTYFLNFDFPALSAQEVLSHFNRLITSSVNQNLMHVYRDFDPALGKILRNVKLAVAAHKAFKEVDRFDETCIVPIHCAANEHLPTADLDFLYSMLQPRANGNEFIPELLSIFSRCMREQEQYSRIVPIISVALTFRALFASKQNISSASADDQSFEISEIIERSVNRIQKYYANGTGTDCDTAIYFQTIRNVLLAKTNDQNGTADSLFTGLKQHINELDTKEYRHNHRAKIEYYYRLCREEIASELLGKKINSGRSSI